MGVRAEQKERTRKTLINVALDMVAEGRSFTSLSLREVTRAASIVPTAFYRHFQSMDELGMAIVAEVLPVLREQMRQLRQNASDKKQDQILEHSVRFFIEFVLKHPREFMFYGREIAGGSKALRNTLRLQTFSFTQDLTDDLVGLGMGAALPYADRLVIADLIVRMFLTTTQDVLEMSGKQEALQSLEKRSIWQLRIISLGVNQWAPKTNQA